MSSTGSACASRLIPACLPLEWCERWKNWPRSAGCQQSIRLDNGPEFISQAIADWAGTRTGLTYIPPGSPWLNGYVESFNSRLRDECLNINSFYSLLHAQVVIGDWKVEYNTVRRHSALGYLTPADYARHCTHEMEPDDSHRDRT